jgi:hypothetical protein
MEDTLIWAADHWRFLSLFITVMLGIFGLGWRFARWLARLELRIMPWLERIDSQVTPNGSSEKDIKGQYLTIRQEIERLHRSHDELRDGQRSFIRESDKQWKEHQEDHRESQALLYDIAGVVKREHPDE